MINAPLTIRMLVQIGLAGLTIAAATLPALAQSKDVGSALNSVREELKIPGMAAIAIRDGKEIAAGASGVREAGKPGAASIDDVSMIGSCGKSATRLLIARLVDQKKLKFESTLGDLLPGVAMRNEYSKVTIEQLLSHRGSIPPYTEIRPGKNEIVMQLHGPPREQRAGLIAHVLKNDEPVGKPGERFVYSNAGYALLGHIAETLLDTTFEDLIREQVFGPLGMKSARVGVPSSEPKAAHLVGHRRTPRGFEAVSGDRGGIIPLSPAGMMSCSARDFAKLATALADCEGENKSKFLSAETAKTLKAIRPGGQSEGVVFLGGEGSYTAGFATWPSKHLAIVVVTNAGDCDAGPERGIEALRAEFAPDAPATPSLAAARSDPDRPRYGFSVQAEDDDWSIADVVDGSPAAKAGLKAGDRILSIGGKAPREIGEGQLGELLRATPLELMVERDGKKLTLRMERPEIKKK